MTKRKNLDLIMESWREWFGGWGLKDRRGPRPVPSGADLEGDLEIKGRWGDAALFMRWRPNRVKLILYRPAIGNTSGRPLGRKEPKLIGMITASKTNKPCIPTTFSVNLAAVGKEYQGKGYGAMMYGLLLAALHWKSSDDDPIGLTADKVHSTSKDASKVWKTMSITRGFKKKETEMGNKKFDYNNSTPKDKDDDCNKSGKNDFKYSLIDTTGAYNSIYSTFIDKHKKNMRRLWQGSRAKYEGNLQRMASDLFDEVY